jgi:hypothetical protein
MDSVMLVNKAEQGDVTSQVMLGIMYAKGVDFDQDFSEAAKWYKMAAEKGDAQAQYLYGLLLANGQGVNQNIEEAANWFKLSAHQGNIDAQYSLAQRLVDCKDFPEAYKWISLACSNSSGDAFKQYSKLKETAAKELNQTQIMQATKEARIISAQCR